MNDRDIEDTRQAPEYDEVVTCIFCGEDFDESVCYEAKDKFMCECCLDDILADLERKAMKRQ